MFSGRGWLVIDPSVWSVKWALAPPICSTIRLTETTFVSILDALHRWRTHSLDALDVDHASPARPSITLMECCSLERGWRGRHDLAIRMTAIKQVEARRHTRYQATSPIPGNTSISPENIAGQSLSVGFRPFPQRPQLGRGGHGHQQSDRVWQLGRQRACFNLADERRSKPAMRLSSPKR